MGNKNFFYNLTAYTFGNIVFKIASFLLLPLYTKFLTPHEYGIVNSLNTLQLFIGILYTLAIDGTIYRLVWDYNTNTERKRFLSTITISIFIISSFFLVLIFIFQTYVGQIYKNISFYPYFIYAILTAYFSIFSNIPMNYLMIQGEARRYVSFSISRLILSNIFILWFVVFLEQGAVGMLKGQMIGMITMVPIFIFEYKKMVSLCFDKKIFYRVLSFSLPTIPPLIAAWILSSSDRIFLERYFSLADVGIYSLSYKMSSIITMISSSFNQAYTPFFYKTANSSDIKVGKAILSKYNKAFFLVVILLIFFTTLFAKEVIILLFDNKYKAAYPFIGLISFSYLFYQFTAILAKYIMQSKKMIQNMFIDIVSAFVNIGLNFFFISHFAIWGAVTATILSYFVQFMLYYIYAKKHCYFISFPWKDIFFLSIPLSFIIIVFYTLDLGILISLVLKIITSLVTFFVIYNIYKKQISALFNPTVAS